MTIEERVKQLEEIQEKQTDQINRLTNMIADLVILLEKEKGKNDVSTDKEEYKN